MINKLSGFTLIEIIIVFSVLAIISVTGIAAFLNYSRSQTLSTATAEVVTMLNTAKSRAMSQKIINPTNESQTMCGANNPFVGYKVLICKFSDGSVGSSDCIGATSNNSYQFQIACTNLPLDPVIETKTLPPNISFPAGQTAVSYLFRALTGAVDITGGASQGTITINGYGLTPKVITVYSDGRIVAN